MMELKKISDAELEKTEKTIISRDELLDKKIHFEQLLAEINLMLAAFD